MTQGQWRELAGKELDLFSTTMLRRRHPSLSLDNRSRHSWKELQSQHLFWSIQVCVFIFWCASVESHAPQWCTFCFTETQAEAEFRHKKKAPLQHHSRPHFKLNASTRPSLASCISLGRGTQATMAPSKEDKMFIVAVSFYLKFTNLVVLTGGQQKLPEGCRGKSKPLIYWDKIWN